MILEKEVKKIGASIDGVSFKSSSTEYFEVYNPSTGTVQALAPKCTEEEMTFAIESAPKEYSAWSSTPATKRVQIDEHLDKLIELLARENCKSWAEADGKDGVRFYTETKAVTTKWFNQTELKQTEIGTWDELCN